MMQQWRETGRLIRQHGWTLMALVLLLCVPLLCLDAVAVLWFDLTPDDADKGVGLLNVMLMPIINGSVVWIVHRGSIGAAPTLWSALRASGSYWSRLFVSYFAISLILLAWLVATVLPPYIVLVILKIQQLYLLIPFGLAGLLLALPRFAFIDPLVVIEGLTPFYARHRSATLVKNRRWMVIRCGAMVYSLPLCLELAGEFLPGWLGLDPRHGGLGFSLAVSLISAVLYIVPIVFFYTYYCAVVPMTAVAALKEPL